MRMSFSLRPWLSRLMLLGAVLVLTGCGDPKPTPYSISLEVWGVFDDSDVLRDIFSDYRALNPYIKDITYRKLSPDTYKEDLLSALASGNGPDIFMMRNTWQAGFGDKVVPAPTLFVTEKKFRETFVDVVAEDFLTSQGQALAVPLSVDSLGLYYNKDLFNAAGIAEPPKTWEELLKDVEKLTQVDAYGNITRSAVSLGTGENINRSADVLLALMLQLGAKTDTTNFLDDTSATKALDFYTGFSRLDSAFYTWSPRQHYSIDAFYEGTLGMTVNYAYQYPVFRQKNAKFNFAVAPLPQFSGNAPVNFANYWGLAVAKNKAMPANVNSGGNGTPLTPDSYQVARVHEAWQLLHYLAFPHANNKLTLYNALSLTSKDMLLKNDPTAVYLEKTKKPAARRDLIEGQTNDVALAPFAAGNLIARTWKPGSNAEAAEALLIDTINAVNRGERTTREALSVLKNRFQQFR